MQGYIRVTTILEVQLPFHSTLPCSIQSELLENLHYVLLSATSFGSRPIVEAEDVIVDIVTGTIRDKLEDLTELQRICAVIDQ